MQDIILLIYLLSLVSGSATLGIGISLYLRSRKVVIRWFLWFIFSLFLFVFSFIFSLLHIQTKSGFLDFSILALILGRTAAVVFISTAPSFYFSLLGIKGGGKLRFFSGLIVLVCLVFFILDVVLRAPLIPVMLMILFTGMILFGLVLIPVRLKTIAEVTLRHALLTFFWITLFFMPLFVIDMNLTKMSVPPWIHTVDNITQPLYFLILNICCIFFAMKYLSRPSFRKEGMLTDYFLKKYRITEREKEIIYNLLQGFSSKEIAGKVYIAPKTVDNHIYNIFQKLEINNRLQLVQMINANTE